MDPPFWRDRREQGDMCWLRERAHRELGVEPVESAVAPFSATLPARDAQDRASPPGRPA